MTHRTLFFGLIAAIAATGASAQTSLPVEETTAVQEIIAEQANPDSIVVDSAFLRVRTLPELDAYLDSVSVLPHETTMATSKLPDFFFLPIVFDHHKFPENNNPFERDLSGDPAMRWFEEQNALNRAMGAIRYNIFSTHPEVVQYNIDMLPEAPKQYKAVIDPSEHTIEIRELDKASGVEATVEAAPVKHRHWIRAFNASLQFSQAYVSPNWYQGGTNNLNILGHLLYNVKLNTEFHPNLLFETTAQYKVGMNNAPNDDKHGYNITDDLFQVNTTFGIKAARRWYYSFTGLFKTQLLKSYTPNTDNLRSSFLSPGELTIGIGMTYNYANAKKTFTLDASLAPLSYSLKTCINDSIKVTAYGIKEGHKTLNSFGSSGEVRVAWKISHNINYSCRLFAFTNYDSVQADWENTLQFVINRFLTTQIYVHARYDSNTPRIADHPDWKKLQLKEILSIGFSYSFSSI